MHASVYAVQHGIEVKKKKKKSVLLIFVMRAKRIANSLKSAWVIYVGQSDLNVTRTSRWICIPVRIREWRGIYSVTRDRARVSWMRNWVIHNELEDLIHNPFSNSPRERSKSISGLHGRAWTKNKASISN